MEEQRTKEVSYILLFGFRSTDGCSTNYADNFVVHPFEE